jgi:hypothetical protein
MARFFLLLPLVACCFLNSTTLVPAQVQGTKKPLAVEDLYRLDQPQTPTLSPDGKRLASVRRWIDGRSKQERHALWLVEGPGRTPLK